jgi:hypothetical protein
MKIVSLTMMLICMASLAFADMTVVSKLKSDFMPGLSGQGQNPSVPKGDSTMIMTIKGQKARIDLPASQMSSIIDLKEGKMYTIQHTQKQVMVMSLDDIKKATDLTAQTKEGQAKPEIKKTGKVETIQGYKCQQYEITGAGPTPSSIYCWITEEVNDSEMEAFRSFSGKMAGFVGLGGVEHPKGMVIRSEARMNVNGRTMNSQTEVESIKRDAVADSVFVIPADYKIIEMTKFDMPPPSPPSR